MKCVFTLLFLCSILSAETVEKRIKVALIDTGIVFKDESAYLEPYLCKTGHIDYTDRGINDEDGHGTHLAGIIAQSMNPKTHCFLIYKWYHSTSAKKITAIAPALNEAVKAGANFINCSFSGTDVLFGEREAVQNATNNKIYVSVAAGNESIDLSQRCNIYPACYPIVSTYFRIVASYNGEERNRMSNFNGPVNAKENGQSVKSVGKTLSGTSMAAAIHTGKLISGEAK